MKKNYFLKLLSIFIVGVLSATSIHSQTQGDIAFISFNADGDDDFAIVLFADISANSILYFTDNESDGAGSITSGEGVLTWNTGSQLIHAGTVITFTDVDNESNLNFGVSIGSLSKSGSFNISPSSKDGLIAYTGTDSNTPTNFIAAIQIGNDSSTLGPFEGDGITLSNTGLVIGTSIIVIDSSASPDGAAYDASRSSEASFNDYYSLLIDTTNWTNVVNGNGETLLPFSQEAFTINSTSWTGNINSNWNLSSNWDNGVPTNSSSVVVPNVTNSPTINSGIEAKVGNLSISSGGILTINSLNSLTVNGLLTVSGSLVMNSSSSLITKGASTGNITYQRNLETNNWYLVSSPVTGETLENLISNHTFATGTGPNIGLATYVNDGSIWNYETAASSGAINSGVGYSVKLNSPGDISFSGTIPTSNIDVSITSNSNSFNLIGNPYPSFIPANSNANSSNVLTLNSAILSEETIWFWDQSLNSYTQINQASSERFIAPTQGFFVSSNGNNSFSFTEAMQSHQTIDSFQKSNTNSPKIVLTLTDGSINKNTEIYYISGTTAEFDNGFDSSIFNGVDNSFAIYTHLVANDNGKDLGIQSLPEDFMESMVIPIGINASSGTEISISANASDLPSDMNIYIEDKNNNSFTQLNEENDKYSTTLSNALNGIGRFFLHVSSSALNVTSSNQENISLYISSNNSLHIIGVQDGGISLEVHNIIGNLLLKSSFKARDVNNITLPNLKKGIYIIHLLTERGRINKKIIIK